MDYVQIVGLQALQGRIDARLDATRAPVGVTGHVIAHLGGDHQLLTLVAKMTAKALLGEAIAAGGVEECDALIDGKMQQSGHFRLIEASVADLPCAQSQHRDS